MGGISCVSAACNRIEGQRIPQYRLHVQLFPIVRIMYIMQSIPRFNDYDCLL